MLARHRNVRRRECKRRRALRDLQQRVQIDRLLRLSGETLHLFFQIIHLCRGDEAEVAALERAVGHLRQKAAGAHAEAFLDRPRKRRIAHRRAAVQNDAADAVFRRKVQKTVEHGQRRQSRALRVQHEYDGTFRPLRDLKGARARGIKADAVVIAHHALDDRHVLPCAVLREEEAQRVVVKKEGVQIAALRADDLAVEHGVNVIGTALRRGDRNAAVDKRLQDRAGHRRLAAAAVRSGNEQSRRCLLHGLPSFCNLYKAFLLVCATVQIPMC